MNEAVISVIDDDEATRSAVAGLMRAKGFNARVFESAEEFLLSDGGALSQCIISDIHMPGLSGIQLKERLDARNCTAPVIFITALVEPRLQSLAEACGAFCLLQKPFRALTLIECVERALAA